MSGTERTQNPNLDTSTDAGRQTLNDENNAARDGIFDTTGNERDEPRQQDERTEADDNGLTRQETIRMSPGDAVRAQMAKKFKRTDDPVPFNGDMTDPEMLYGEVARQDLAAEEEQQQQEQPVKAAAQEQQPAKKRLIVRGQEMFLTDDEILARASMVTAADSYLKEARDILDEAKTIKAERAGRDRRHPDGQSSTQDDEQALEPPHDDQRHPADTKRVVELIQFGDPEEAANALDEIIDRKSDEKTDKRQLERVINNDLVKSKKALKDFVAANPDLNADKMAAIAIEANLYDVYAEEIQALGVVDADKIPKDPKQLADWHRFYRVHGHQVSDAAKALEKAKDRFVAWRGKPPEQQQTRKAAQDRVEVTVNRTDRRAAIPNQPTRAVSPRPDSATRPTATKSRSDVISGMKRSRGQATAT